jgi:hypothetical protein
MYSKGRTIALKNDQTTQSNIDIGIEAGVWGSRFAGVNSQVQSGEACVFLVGVSIKNLQKLKQDDYFKEKLKGFPNVSNQNITDELLAALELNVEEVLLGETTSDWYVDSSEIWPPREFIKKKGNLEKITFDYYKNRFRWKLTHKVSNLLISKDTFDISFIKSILLSLRDKCVAPFDIEDKVQIDNFQLGMFLSEPENEEDFQDFSQNAPSVNLGDGPIERASRSASSAKGKWARNPVMASTALKASNHRCEANITHITFTSKRTNNNYTEAHHLIPMEFQGLFDFSIDVPENIISLCSNCHDKIHYAIDADKVMLIEKLYNERIDGLKMRKIMLTLKELKKYYGV